MIKTIFILMLIPLIASGAFYMSPTGDDNADGTTWETALQTIGCLNDIMQAGDTVYFASGTWYDSQIRPPQGGDINHQTVYACSTFNVTSKHDPKIFGGEIVTNWIQDGTNIYRRQWSGNECYESGCGSLVQDLEVLQMIDIGYTTMSAGRYYYQNGIIYVWCYDNKNPNNCTMLASCKPPLYFGTYNPDIAYVRFWGLDLRYGQQAAVFFNARTNHISVEHCNIGSAGHTSANAAGVFASADENGKNMENSNTFGHHNTIRSCSVGNLRSFLTSWCRIGTCDGINIYSENYFTVDSCYFYPPIGTAINFKNQLGGATTIGRVAKCNIITGTMRHGIDIWKHPYLDSIYGNTIAWPSIHGIFVHTSNNPWDGNITIMNNTIYGCGDRGIEIWDDGGIGHCGEGINIFNNIIDIAFVGMAFDYWPNNVCQNNCLIDNNLYHFIDRGNESSCGYTFASWQNCGFDLNGQWGTDPLFENAGVDFSRPTVEQECDYYIGDWHCVNVGAIQNTYEPFEYLCGDANGSGNIDIDDAMFLLSFIFSDGSYPDPYEAGNANGSTEEPIVDIDDIVYLLEYIFADGPAPICEEL